MKRKKAIDVQKAKLVTYGPEERVRQGVVRWLRDEMGYAHIGTEVRVKSGGRCDVPTFGDGDHDGALLVAECKRPGHPLDPHEAKLAQYARQTSAKYALLANAAPSGSRYIHGADTSLHYRVIRSGRLERIRHVPSYRALKARYPTVRWTEPQFRRWPYAALATPDAARRCQDALGWQIVGVDTEDWIGPIAMDLFGLLADDRERAGRFRRGDLIIEDLGCRPHEFSNASSGSWYSKYYRGFHVRHGPRELIARIGVMSQQKSAAHTHIGTAGGYTVLLVGITDAARDHASLELKLDSALEPDRRSFSLVHDGAATGARGRVPNERILRHVRRNAPELVRNDKVYLGRIPALDRITWTHETRTLVANLVRYATLRDEVRDRVARERAE